MSLYVQLNNFCCVPTTILHVMVCILSHVWTIWLEEKMAAIHKRFKFSLWRSHPVDWGQTLVIESCHHTSKQCLLELGMIQRQRPSTMNKEPGPLPTAYRQLFWNCIFSSHIVHDSWYYFCIFAIIHTSLIIAWPITLSRNHLSLYSRKTPKPALYSSPLKKMAAQLWNRLVQKVLYWLVNCDNFVMFTPCQLFLQV